jgi:NtrC-family two-component system sensor histidine kinase KinB
MKIKTKLRLGFGFLFLIVLFFGGVSLYYMNKISESSKVILKDNYKSLKFTGNMRSILEDDAIPLSDQTLKQFSMQLNLEQNNVTEKGEKEAVVKLKEAFLKISDPSAALAIQHAAVGVAFK